MPKGVSGAAFDRALAQFRRVVGEDWVFTSDEDVAMYRDAYSPLRGEPGEIFAGAAVAPDSVEQVQEIARIANSRRIPLYPVSTGRNLGYGGSAPVLPGSVVLDLKRMSRILEVNEDQAFALVEPGVSYMDLYRHIKERGLRLWVSFPAPGWGSVMGNALDRGVGGTLFPYNDHFAAHCGMEVVLADGAVVRTGMGALPGARTWQSYMPGVGPSVDGLFAQSNFGIVTKMGMQLIREPEARLGGSARFPRYGDIRKITRLYNQWLAAGFIQSGPAVSSPVVNLTRDRAFAERHPTFARTLGTGNGPNETQWDEFATELGQHFWDFSIALYGPEEALVGAWTYAARRLEEIGGIVSAPPQIQKFPLTDADRAKNPLLALLEAPSLYGFGDGTRAAGYTTASSGHLWFSPILAIDGDEIIKAREIYRGVLNKWQMGGDDIMSTDTPMVLNRIAYLIYGFRFSADLDRNRRLRDCYRDMVRVGALHGWGEYRTHTIFMDEVTDTYSFNNHALLRLQERIKDAVDPNGILSAGRYGLWPRSLRKAK